MKSALHSACFALAIAAVGILAGCDQQPAAPPGKAQATCPVMGGKVDKAVFADYEGKRVYFCCPDCIAKFKAEPQKYVKKLEDEGVTLAKTPKGG